MRAGRLPRRFGENYEKLDVEAAYLARGGTALRLPVGYGEHDGQRREEFVRRPAPAEESVARSVRWHLEHPPAVTDAGFAAGDQALALAQAK